MKYSKIIDTIYQSVLSADNLGKVPTYIPELAQVNPDKFGVYFIASINNRMGLVIAMKSFQHRVFHMYLLWIVRSNDFDLLDAFLVKSLYNEFIVTKEDRCSFLREVARNL